VHVWELEQLEEAKPGFVQEVKPEALTEMDRMVDDEIPEGWVSTFVGRPDRTDLVPKPQSYWRRALRSSLA
jgi:hypothetical protein